MDYLCELPTDAARKKALNSLPPTLDATYARILRRVKESNHDVQVLVQRSLRWITHAGNYLSVAALCEAVSINPGDTFLNRDSIPQVEEILRCCSSLVRKPAFGNGLELAHFTVKEYLQKLNDVADNEFGAYHIQDLPCNIELAEVCLTYLNLDDFSRLDITDEEARTRRMKDYALRRYAVEFWHLHAKVKLTDERIFHLIQQLFSPSKSSNFITWAQDYNLLLYGEYQSVHNPEITDASTFDAVNLCLATTGPLHYAAILRLPELCTWLIHEGCEVNQRSPYGTPLQCTILAREALVARIGVRTWYNGSPEPEDLMSTLTILVDCGADPNCYYDDDLNCYYDDGKATVSVLGMVAGRHWKYASLKLIQCGAVVDEYARTRFRGWKVPLEARSEAMLAQRLGEKDLKENEYASILERMLALDEFQTINDLKLEIPVSELQHGAAIVCLRLAAKFGRLGTITELLVDRSIDLNTAEPGTGRTALHYAAENGHSQVVALLLAHGADSNLVDGDGRTPISLATEVVEPHCFLNLLRQGCDISARDLEGYTMIHYAAANGNMAALIAVKECLDIGDASECSKAVQDPTMRLHSELGEIGEAESLPTGQNFLQAISQKSADGTTPLHLAVEGASLDVLNFLLDSGCDPKALMDDGSTTLHCIAGNRCLRDSHIDILNLLLEHRVDPCRSRCDGATPLHVLIQETSRGSDNFGVSLKILGALARAEGTLLQTNAEGLTALHLLLRTCFDCEYAVEGAIEDAFEWEKAALTVLLEAGADLQAMNSQNQSALRYLLDTFTATTECSNPKTLSHMMSVIIEHAREDESLIKMIVSPAVLVLAIKFGHSELIQKLLDRSPAVDVKAATLPAMTPMQAACHYRCDRNILSRLLNLSKARSDPAGLGSDLIRRACQRNDTEACGTVLMLLKAGSDPSRCSIRGESALMLAALAGNVDIVKLLIGHGVDSSVSDAQGCNVAHYALEGGDVGVVYALRRCKLDWGAKGEMLIHGKMLRDVTALHLAAKNRDSMLLEYLIDEKLISDIDCVTGDRITPLYIAVWSALPRNVDVLLLNGANANIMVDRGRESPLHMAARAGYQEIVSGFLRHGCDVTIPRGDGLDCQMIALKYGFKELAQMFAEWAQKQGMYRAHTD